MKINYLSTILSTIFCLSLFISACVNSATKPNAEPKQGNGAKIVPTKTMDATELLNFAESYSNLSQEEQKLELANTNQVLALNPNDLLNRMKLVMILGLPGSSYADPPKAQGLLQQLLQENILTNSQLAFAHVLFDYLIVVNKGGKSDQKHVDALQLKLDATQQKLDTTQLKLDAAQQKLDELKNIEKSMGGREDLPKAEVTPRNEPVPKIEPKNSK